MPAVLRVDETGRVLAANGAARELFGRCEGSRCCDLVLARTDQRCLVCVPGCAAALVAGTARDQRGITASGRVGRLVCTKVGDEVVVVLELRPLEACASRLTSRERQALQVVARGGNNKEVARQLCVSEHTARTHVERAREKLSARTRAEAVARALARGDIEAI